MFQPHKRQVVGDRVLPQQTVLTRMWGLRYPAYVVMLALVVALCGFQRADLRARSSRVRVPGHRLLEMSRNAEQLKLGVASTVLIAAGTIVICMTIAWGALLQHGDAMIVHNHPVKAIRTPLVLSSATVVPDGPLGGNLHIGREVASRFERLLPLRPAATPLTPAPRSIISSARIGLEEGSDDTSVRPVSVLEPFTAIRSFATNTPLPTRIVVPAVGIDTPVVEVGASAIDVDGRITFEWQVADWAAGHHNTSARPGEGGNIVIAGHDDVRGEVFRGLHDIEIGDEVELVSDAGTFNYRVAEIHLRQYEGVPVDDRVAIGMFTAPMPEERLTLVTCWPYQVDTHRLIVVAKPIQ